MKCKRLTESMWSCHDCWDNPISGDGMLIAIIYDPTNSASPHSMPSPPLGRTLHWPPLTKLYVSMVEYFIIIPSQWFLSDSSYFYCTAETAH